ncbi:MAG: hypothetical protein U0625_08500 [Phycisphaerales bacterium]
MSQESTGVSDLDERFATRAILGTGRGRVIALAVVLGAAIPIGILRWRGDALVARWTQAQAGDEGAFLWRWASFLGSPLFWFFTAVLGFGLAAAFNWPNTARWMGMLALAVMWAGLADIAVGGNTAGAATVGAIACVLTLWQPRAWPIWTGLAFVTAVGRMVTTGVSTSHVAASVLLGTAGVLLIEYGWHHCTPEAPPKRGAAPRS